MDKKGNETESVKGKRRSGRARKRREKKENKDGRKKRTGREKERNNNNKKGNKIKGKKRARKAKEGGGGGTGPPARPRSPAALPAFSAFSGDFWGGAGLCGARSGGAVAPAAAPAPRAPLQGRDGVGGCSTPGVPAPLPAVISPMRCGRSVGVHPWQSHARLCAHTRVRVPRGPARPPRAPHTLDSRGETRAAAGQGAAWSCGVSARAAGSRG